MQPDYLWAPWRMTYIKQLGGEKPLGSDGACFLCDAAQVQVASEAAQQQHVLVRDGRGLVMLNLYPYTSGHLLVAPAQHVAELADLTGTQRSDLMELVVLAERLLRVALDPQGLNVGINLGRCAGAGLPGHLHVHVVPRWAGDANFMHAIAGVRVIPEALEATYAQLRDALKRLGSAV